MTNREYLIGKLHDHISFVDQKTIEVIFEAINKRERAEAERLGLEVMYLKLFGKRK